MTRHIDYGFILPRDEMTRLIEKHRQPKGLGSYRGVITHTDLLRHGLRHMKRGRLKRISLGVPDKTVGPMTLARLSRFLVLIEMGLVVKRDGKIVYLEDPEPPPKEIVFKVDLAFGRPKLLIQKTPEHTVQTLLGP